jgi:hypothetical protein
MEKVELICHWISSSSTIGVEGGWRLSFLCTRTCQQRRLLTLRITSPFSSTAITSSALWIPPTRERPLHVAMWPSVPNVSSAHVHIATQSHSCSTSATTTIPTWQLRALPHDCCSQSVPIDCRSSSTSAVRWCIWRCARRTRQRAVRGWRRPTAVGPRSGACRCVPVHHSSRYYRVPCLHSMCPRYA